MSSRLVLQHPSRKNPVKGFIEQSSSRSPRTFLGAFGRPLPFPPSSLSIAGPWTAATSPIPATAGRRQWAPALVLGRAGVRRGDRGRQAPVILSAFASGLTWCGSLAGKKIYSPNAPKGGCAEPFHARRNNKERGMRARPSVVSDLNLCLGPESTLSTRSSSASWTDEKGEKAAVGATGTGARWRWLAATCARLRRASTRTSANSRPNIGRAAKARGIGPSTERAAEGRASGVTT